MAKRWRSPNAKEGQLLVRWGKIDGDEDLCYAWGEGTNKRDANLLHHMLSGFGNTIINERRKSFLQELDDRGYDLTTLKFSIEKKK